MSKVKEYCIKHGYQDFFLADIWELGDEVPIGSQGSWEIVGEALHCPHCFPEHPDNPAVIETKEQEDIRSLNSCMAL